MQKGYAVVFILVGILILIGVAGGAYYFGQQSLKSKTPSDQIACTQDAKLCPDGSSVGRVGPKCEFTPCPSVSPSPSDETANWKTYTGKQYIFKYPDSWTNDVSDQKYFESGIIVHSKNVDYADFSNVNTGGFIYKFLLLDILPKSDFVNLDAVVSEFGKTQNNESVISESSILLDGQPAKKRVIEGSNFKELFLAFQYPNDKGYSWLIMISSISSFEENQKVFNQILSSFKFIN